jgi:hypothetical protein
MGGVVARCGGVENLCCPGKSEQQRQQNRQDDDCHVHQ